MEWAQSVEGVIYYVAWETFFTLNILYSSIVFLELQGKFTNLLSLKRGFLLKFPDLNWIPYFYFVASLKFSLPFSFFSDLYYDFPLLCFLELTNNTVL